ncbi:MAG: TIM barrel protein [Pseudorhodobacter sp.]|nr:TIM barrel protein [Pseudorhodobacter sp.]
MLFTDLPDYPARIRAAHAAGYAAVEFWGWRAKDLGAIAAALHDTGLPLTGFVADPMLSLTDPANHAAFLAALPGSIATAQRLGAPFLYIQAGKLIPDTPRATMVAALVTALTAAADILQGSGIILLLEPVSDAKGGFLTHAAEGLAIIDTVNRAEIRLLYDLYHAAVAAEDTVTTIGPHMPLIGHIHVADHPGRVAPGLGLLNLNQDLAWTRAQGYKGLFGLEYLPGGRT